MESEKATNGNSQHRKKVRGALHLIRVATYMIRRRSAGKTNIGIVNPPGKSLWKRLVGAMRPLHHHNLDHHPTILPITGPPASPSPPASPAGDSFYDVYLPPPSPDTLDDTDDVSSRYASVDNLRELDESASDSEGNGDGECDDMQIDTRAEEFIAKFYEQMRLQRLDSMNRYNEMIERGSS